MYSRSKQFVCLRMEVQTNNRAEFSAFISAMLNTRGRLHYWTDSEVLFKGWLAGRHTKPASWSSMGDLWVEIGAALSDRGHCRVEVLWMNSHLSLAESMQKKEFGA